MPKQVDYLPPLPNKGSVGQTPASLAIDGHYANLLLVERWDWERYVRLTNFLRLTPHELASLVLLPHRYLDEYASKNGLPMAYNFARPIAMLLTLVEAQVTGHLTKDVIEDPFPNIGKH